MFGSDIDETGDELVESVLAEGGVDRAALGQGGVFCSANLVAEAIIDREVVRRERVTALSLEDVT